MFKTLSHVMLMTSLDELNLSWTEEFLRTTEGGITYSAELMDTIFVHILYVNGDQEVFHQMEETCPLTINNEKNVSTLQEQQLLELILKYRNHEKKRYKCSSLLQYNIDADPQIIIDNIHSPTYNFQDEHYFSSFNVPCNMHFSPSLFIFHSVNCVYLLFQEMTLVNAQPISILKKSSLKKTKKKVRISDKIVVHHPKTRKYKEST